MYLERRALPKSNKITYQRYVDHCHKLHKSRLKKVKSHIDNKPPKTHKHLKRNLKREQMMEERFATIERENRILLSKMSDIMQKNTLDNVNHSTQYSHSLNKQHRQAQLRKITDENQAILRRIQAREPVYNHYEWEEDRVKNEKYLRNIMEYPGGAGDTTIMGGEFDGSATRMESGILGDSYGGARLDPMDPEYERSSRERLQQQTESPPFPEPGPGYDYRYDNAGGASAGGAGGGAGAYQTDGPAAEGDTGDEPEATRFSSGVKLDEDYLMVSQTNAGEITIYNPFTSETFNLNLPAGEPVPEDLETFRAMVDRVVKAGDGSFTLS